MYLKCLNQQDGVDLAKRIWNKIKTHCRIERIIYIGAWKKAILEQAKVLQTRRAVYI